VPIRLACLDLTGTLVTDDGVVERAFVEALVSERLVDEGEVAGALDVVRRTMGQSKIDVFGSLLRDEARATTANKAFEAAYERAVRRGEVRPVAGAEQLLRDLRKAGVQVCVLTGFAPATRDALIETLHWRLLVDLALSTVDVGRGRPWPDLVLHAAAHFHVDVQEVAVVGDTVSDLLCGSRAGAAVVAGIVVDPDRRSELRAAPHTHLVDSIGELADILVGA
jgi:phosphonatase-like hydrolase